MACGNVFRELFIPSRGVELGEPVAESQKLLAREFGDSGFNLADGGSGSLTTLFRESGPAWVERWDNASADPVWLKDGSFLWLSERSGFRHLYHYRRTGVLANQVTSGEWEVRSIDRVDQADGWIYFSGTERSILGSDVYRIRLDGTNRQRLTSAPGTHRAVFNPGGTLFLDEVAALKPELQAKLLRVLQEREIERVGGNRRIGIDVRIIAATNVDLKQAVSTQTFREDLYYRLNVVRINIVPLRERRDDIPVLIDHFIRKYNHEFTKQIEGITPDALTCLQEYSWPGNVRELQNVIERSVGLVTGSLIRLSDLPVDLMLPDPGSRIRQAQTLPLKQACEQFERQIVLRVLERVGWNRSEAARLLGLHRNTLKLKLAKWKMRPSEDHG